MIILTKQGGGTLVCPLPLMGISTGVLGSGTLIFGYSSVTRLHPQGNGGPFDIKNRDFFRTHADGHRFLDVSHTIAERATIFLIRCIQGSHLEMLNLRRQVF